MATTAALVSAALLLTACNADEKKDSASGKDTPASATATPGDGKKKENDGTSGGSGTTAPPSAQPSSPSQDNDGDGNPPANNCPRISPGAKLIKVDSITGADNNLTATDAARRCIDRPGTSGAPLYPVGQSKTYSSIVNASITFIDDKRGHRNEQPAKSQTAVSHVKTCAEPEGDGQHQSAEESGEYCDGGNFYEVKVQNGQIVHMEEVYE
ncbi:hypothetical protein AB0D04_06400 [Streptomyces sp. NPDC048483]|uniref:hypothetical protein n=1 Tax=Streptomyces sp. NPDC048483 TaxID=3154927 RepID=UPI00342EBCF1